MLKSRPWLVLPFAVAVFIGGALSVQSWALGLLLQDDARGGAVAWTNFISGKVADFHQISSGAPPSAETVEFMKWIQSSSRIFRYKIFDTGGRSRYVFDRIANYSLDGGKEPGPNAQAIAAATSGQVIVETKSSAPGDLIPFSSYAETYVPVFGANGTASAVVEVYLDQTAKHAQLARISVIGGGALAILMTLAFGLPAFAWYCGEVDKRRSDDRIRHLANYDSLSNLPNRARTTELLIQALAEAGPSGRLAVMKINVDRFADVNSWLGLTSGDCIIQTVAERLSAIVDENSPRDHVGRLFGDEFVVISRTSQSWDAAIQLADRIGRLIARPIDVNGSQVRLTACIGIAVAPGDGDDANRLLKSAKLALASAKAQGRGRVQLFTSDLDRDLQARRAVEQEVSAALANGTFAVHYQPICATENGTILGFEALARLPAESGDFIPPSVFIPATERMGLINQLGARILTEACVTAASWPEHLTVSVNLSALQFARPGIAATVAATLRSSGIAPSRLLLEITESVLLADGDCVMSELTQLKQLGTRIVMDDFGTGYSSLSYLWRFPFDKIKIDSSFMSALEAPGAPAEKIMRTITGLGHSLGMVVCVEGVETPRQALSAIALGCDEVQGFHFGRPVAPIELPAIIMSAFRRSIAPPPALETSVDGAAL